MVIGVLVVITMAPGFDITSLIFLAEDINDKTDVARAKIFQFSYSLTELVFKTIVICFQLFRWRKKILMLSISFFAIGWAGISLSSYLQVPIMAGFAGYFIIVALGPMIYPTFNIYLGEVCPREFVGVAYSIFEGGMMISSFVLPIFFSQNNPDYFYTYGTLSFSVLNFFLFIFVYFYFIETKDLTKKEIFERIRGMSIGMGKDGEKDEVSIPDEYVRNEIDTNVKKLPNKKTLRKI